MKLREIVLLESAKQDLRNMTVWLTQEVSPETAHRYVSKVQSRIATLQTGSERGTVRDRVRGLRVIGILPRTSVVFSVSESQVFILRVLHGGQAWDTDLTAEDDDLD